MKQKRIIGRTDKLDFPDLGLTDVIAKIDTGAYGNAIHCHKMEVIESNGESKLKFKLLDPSHPEYKDRYFEVAKFRSKKVKSSSGEAEERYAIKTSIVLFGKKYVTEFSLTNRKNMRNPILIGRKFLSNKFLVDVQVKDASYNEKRLPK